MSIDCEYRHVTENVVDVMVRQPRALIFVGTAPPTDSEFDEAGPLRAWRDAALSELPAFGIDPSELGLRRLLGRRWIWQPADRLFASLSGGGAPGADVIAGGIPIEWQQDHGRVLRPNEVRAASTFLQGLTFEALAPRLDPRETHLETFERAYAVLRDYYAEAAALGRGMLGIWA
jgi:hypothetical protein